jgi:hypothetical protein
VRRKERRRLVRLALSDARLNRRLKHINKARREYRRRTVRELIGLPVYGGEFMGGIYRTMIGELRGVLSSIEVAEL